MFNYSTFTVIKAFPSYMLCFLKYCTATLHLVKISVEEITEVSNSLPVGKLLSQAVFTYLYYN